jgi:DUF1680 family protein
VSNVTLPSESELKQEFRPGLLGGVVAIVAGKQPFVAVPYYAWSNRGRGEMTVWIKTE